MGKDGNDIREEVADPQAIEECLETITEGPRKKQRVSDAYVEIVSLIPCIGANGSHNEDHQTKLFRQRQMRKLHQVYRIVKNPKWPTCHQRVCSCHVSSLSDGLVETCREISIGVGSTLVGK